MIFHSKRGRMEHSLLVAKYLCIFLKKNQCLALKETEKKKKEQTKLKDSRTEGTE
jgi:hypothetical protein